MKMTTLNVCENLSKCTTERPGLFADNFRNTRCSKSACESEDIINKIETVMEYFMRSSTAKSYSTQIESILYALDGLSCIAASKKLQVLSVLLREAAESVACCDQMLKEPLARIQIKALLNLASNFIRKWKEKPCETQPRLNICKFCDGIINDDEAQLYAHAPKCTMKIPSDGKYEINDISRHEDRYRNRIGSRIKTERRTPTRVLDERQCDVIPDVSGWFDSRRVKCPARSDIEAGQLDEIADGDPSKANGDRSLRRGKTETSADRARSDGDGARTTDAAAERIREKRDDNSYRRKLGGIDRKQDRRPVQRDVEEEEANGSRAAAGKRWRRAGGTEEDATTKRKDGVERDRESGRPYRHRRAEERRETRLPDSGVRKIGRLDRAEERRGDEEEKTISQDLAKRPEVERDESGRLDRREDEEKLVARDRKVAKAGKDEEEETTPPSEGPSKPIEYQLSNVHFVKLGWTVLPIIKTVRKIVQYEARPAKPNLDWFKRYRHKDARYYDDGSTPFLRFHPDGSGELFYPNGTLAVRVYRPENRKYDMYTVFTPGGKDALGIERKSQILAIFDTMGHGVVFDEDGAARLSYNQIGGIFTDSPAGLPFAWIWNAKSRGSILETTYTERLADRLQMKFFSKSTKSSGNVKTPISPSNSRSKEKKVVEVQKPVVEQRQEEEVGSKSNFNQDSFGKDILHVKVICMKLNEFLGLRIVDQRNIALRFSARNKSIRIELGTVLNFNKEAEPSIVEAKDWKSDMLRCRFQEKLFAKLKSDSSMYDLTREYREVKRYVKERKAMIIKYRPFAPSYYKSSVLRPIERD